MRASPFRQIRHLLPAFLLSGWLGLAGAADFQSGDLVVYRVGSGTGALSSSGTAVFVDEYAPNGTLVQSVALPTAAAGANHRLVASGSAGSEGQLNRSSDGRFVVVTGYDAALATTGLSGSASATVPRTIGLIDVHGAIDTSTALTDASTGNNPRSATSDGAGNLWFAGAAGGLRYAPIGASVSTAINATANVSAVEIFSNQLWVSSAKNLFIASVGTGLPITAGQTSTNLALPSVTPNAFVLLQLGAGPFPDTVYAADNTATIRKFSLVSGGWVASGSYALAGVTGLTASVSGSSVTLYATNGTTIASVTDSSGYAGTANGALATVVTASTNTAFRGVALAPAAPPTISAVTDLTIAENTASPAIPVTIGGASAQLALTASAANAALLPASGIAITGSGANRAVILTPAIGAIGSAAVQLTATDAASGIATSTSFTLTVVDTAPTISAIPDQTIFHDTTSPAIPVTLGDAETPATSLILSVTSSNPTLLPNSGILIVGVGANRSLNLIPAAGQAGATTVNLLVDDGQGQTASTSFVLTVSNGTADTAPTISTIADQQVTENGAIHGLAVTIGDQETPAANLLLTATASSNPALLPLSGIVIDGTGAQRSVSLLPANGQIGTSTVTLTVDDTQGLTTSTSFVLTVTDTAPTITPVAAQSILTSTSSSPLAVTVGDAETPAGSLILTGASSNQTLLANAGIAVAGAGAARTVTLTPAAGQNGTTTVTLTVDDGQGQTATASFLLTVAADRAPVAGTHAMAATGNRITVVPASQFAALDSDPDGDALLITAVSGVTASGGSAALVDGKIIYTPPAGFTGSDSFTYTLRDGARVSNKIPTGAPLGFADVAHTVPVNHSGYGSSLAAVPGVPGEYYLMTDRGPNGDNSGITSGPALSDPNAKTFPVPGFSPEIAHVRWNADGSVSVLNIIRMQDENGVGITGLPTHLNNPADPNSQIIDVGYDIVGNPLPVDPNGIDSEGLAAMADGSFWVSDEYGPWLVHFDATGKTIERIGPYATNAQGHKLPAVLARRLTNKGMEGLTVTPDGSMLVGMMQSALVNDPVNDPIGNPYANDSTNTYGKNSKKNLMLRVITYRLAGGVEAVGTVHQYAYFLGDPTPGAPAASGNKQAISEITAISNTDILVDERDGNFPSDVGGSVKKSWVFHLPSGQPNDATPIDDASDSAAGLTFAGATLETLVYNKKGSDAATVLAAHGLKPLAKDPAPLVDLSLVGLDFTHDKVEGMLAQNGTVLYSNDDDFGLNGSVTKVITGSYPVGSYPLGTPGGLTTDYSQLLQVDPTKLMAATGTIVVTVTADTPPTIAAAGAVVTPQNTPTGAIAVTIGDAETPAANLALTATSSNPTLISAAGIALGGAGSARSLVLTPAAGRSGTATITLTVDDLSGMTASTNVVLTVLSGTPVVTWPAPAPIVYGAPLGGAQLDATANVPGTFTYTPAAGTILPVGSTTLATSFAPADTADYVPVGASVPLTVTRASLTVTADDQHLSVGQPLPTLTVHYAGFVNGDTASALTTPVTVTTTATASSPAGSYPITVSGGAAANYTLSYVAGTLVIAAPVNDAFAARLPLTGLTATATAWNKAATKETGEPNHAGNKGGKSLWWTWTAPAAGTLTVDTLASDFDTLLGLYTGSGYPLTDAAANNNVNATVLQSKVTLAVTAGAVYQIAVDGKGGASGTIVLNLALVPFPANDDFAAAIVLDGTAGPFGSSSGALDGSNVGATKQTGEPKHAAIAGGTSVWYQWTAPAAGTFTVDTLGSSFDTLLGVYTGSAVNGLAKVGSNDDASAGTVQSSVTVTVTANTVYHIAVDGKAGATGAIHLDWSFVPTPPNDAFAAAIALSGNQGTLATTNAGASTETGEPAHAGDAGGASIWYTWTAPAAGFMTIDTLGSSFDTLLAVYTGTKVKSLTAVASDDDVSATVLQSQVTFKVKAGTTYRIAIDGYAGATGAVTLTWAFAPSGGG